MLRRIGYRSDDHVEVFIIPDDLDTFRTDLASVPSVFGWLVSRSGMFVPLVMHDALVRPARSFDVQRSTGPRATGSRGEPSSDLNAAAVRVTGVIPSTLTEQVNPHTADLDALTTLDQVRRMNDEDQLVAPAVRAADMAIAAAVEGVVSRLRPRPDGSPGGRLFYLGAGTPGRLGILDASEVPPTFGSDQVIGIIAGGRHAVQHSVENAEDDHDQGAADLDAHGLTAGDAVIAIAASGHTPYVLGGIGHARRLGAFTAAIVCNPGSPIGAAAQVPIEVLVGPEVITGSTRLKSGTAQKLVLNTISTLVMVQLGKTYGNLMVDVSGNNEKLQRRAVWLVSTVTGVDEVDAAAALAKTDGSVKVACVVLLTGSSPDQARALLKQHHGFLRAAVS